MTQAAFVRDTGLASESLVRLFKVRLEFTSDSPSDAVLPAEGRDGAYIGSGHGAVTGERVGGTMSWSLYAGDCLYPRIRKGEAVPDDLHLCTLNPRGFIETQDGAQIRFAGRGYCAGEHRIAARRYVRQCRVRAIEGTPMGCRGAARIPASWDRVGWHAENWTSCQRPAICGQRLAIS